MASSSKHQDTTLHDFSDFQSPDEASFDRLVHAIDRAYHRPFQMMWRSFLSGMMAAIGAAVGTALIVILSGYLFQVFGGQSVLKNYINHLQDGLVHSQTKSVEILDPNNQ